MSKKKNLIMGFGTNQTPESLAAFLRSAREFHTIETCEIILVTNSTASISGLLEETHAVAMYTPNVYSPRANKYLRLVNRPLLHAMNLIRHIGARTAMPELAAGYRALLETWHHPHFARWLAYERVLGLANDFDRVILSDVKDVVFQSNVFDEIEPGFLHLFEDMENFDEDTVNGRWYRAAYGNADQQRVRDVKAICVGVLGGDVAAVRRMVEEFVDEICRSPFRKVEQAMFNRMLLRSLFTAPIKVHRNLDGCVAHLATGIADADFLISPRGIADSRTSRIWPVVHMYDRFPATMKSVMARYL